MCLLLSSFGILSIRECIWLNDYYMCLEWLFSFFVQCFGRIIFKFMSSRSSCILFFRLFFFTRFNSRLLFAVVFHFSLQFKSISFKTQVKLCPSWLHSIRTEGQRFLRGCTLNTVWCQCTQCTLRWKAYKKFHREKWTISKWFSFSMVFFSLCAILLSAFRQVVRMILLCSFDFNSLPIYFSCYRHRNLARPLY